MWISVIIGFAIILAPVVVAFVAMGRDGRRWAKARLVSYSVVALQWCLGATSSGLKGNLFGLAMGLSIAFLAGRGAWRTYEAWQEGDYRPASQRSFETTLIRLR
jgi:hypothetical protein